MWYGYIRVSTQRFEEVLSLETQQDIITRYAAYRLRDVPAGGWFSDPGVSGGVPLGNRKYGARMLLALEPGDHVVLAKLDRGFRNASDCLNVLADWTKRKINFHVLDMQVDSSTDTGRLFIGLLACFSQFERERISTRCLESVVARRSRGLPVGPAPYGFRLTGPDGNRRLAPAPELRRLGRFIVEWKLKGYSFIEITAHLNREGCTNKKRPWSVMACWRAFVGECRLQMEEGLDPSANVSPKAPLPSVPPENSA